MLNVAEINLSTLCENAKTVKKKLKKGTKLCAVVKADAYGHGGVRVASALHNIADCFAVALAEEGIALRQGGIAKDVLVLLPIDRTDLERAVYYRLTFTVTCIDDVKLLEAEGKRQNTVIKVHVKYDTGMNRQGVSRTDDLEELFEYIAGCRHIYAEGIYSHFAKPENKKSLNRAMNKFLLAISVAVRYNDKIIRHISASGGFLQGIELDMVRIGILLYGYKPFKSARVDVKPVMKVYAPVMNARKLKKGDAMFYGEKTSDKNMTVHVIRFGYADGLPRREVAGQFNNRCMDVTAVTHPETSGRMAVVMSDADVLAKKYGTISYEILTHISMRAEKTYLF